MSGWADDPELLATFRAEVEERVASLVESKYQVIFFPSPSSLSSNVPALSALLSRYACPFLPHAARGHTAPFVSGQSLAAS